MSLDGRDVSIEVIPKGQLARLPSEQVVRLRRTDDNGDVAQLLEETITDRNVLDLAFESHMLCDGQLDLLLRPRMLAGDIEHLALDQREPPNDAHVSISQVIEMHP